MKVLMLAFECNPYWPSLPAVAFNYACALAETEDVTLVTQVLNRPNIEKAGTGRLRVEYVDIDRISVPLDRVGKLLRGGNALGWSTQVVITYPVYIAFEHAVWRKYRERLDAGEFDLVHRSTPMTPTLPSPMAKWSSVPFVVGPLNGGLGWPPQFRHMQSQEHEWLRPLRRFHAAMPYHRSMLARSAAILAGFDHTIREIPPQFRGKVVDFPEIGVDPSLFASADDSPRRYESEPLTVLFVGRMVPLKLPEVVVGAFASSPLLRRQRLLIVGDGPDMPRIKKMVASEGLAGCVETTGLVGQPTVASLMRSGHVLAFPSVKDLGAGVVAEAMASGLCPVALDWGAASVLVDSSRGIKVPVGTVGELTCRFARVLEGLAEDRRRLRALAGAAQAFAREHLSWRNKAARTVDVYRWVLSGRNGHKPSFWAPPAHAAAPTAQTAAQRDLASSRSSYA